MKFYFIKTPRIIMRFYRNYTWRFSGKKKEVYLTFDDGPIPVVTEYILDILKKHAIKATFFCVGENIQKHPSIYKRLIKEGHQVGNHTYNHLNGWKTTTKTYIENVEKSAMLQNTKLFRPTYGKITKSQADILIQKGYKIIMWSLLSGDFDTTITHDNCFKNIVKNIKSGDIIVLHDNIKSYEKITAILEKTILHLKKRGYVFKVIA